MRNAFQKRFWLYWLMGALLLILAVDRGYERWVIMKNKALQMQEQKDRHGKTE